MLVTNDGVWDLGKRTASGDMTEGPLTGCAGGQSPSCPLCGMTQPNLSGLKQQSFHCP